MSDTESEYTPVDWLDCPAPAKFQLDRMRLLKQYEDDLSLFTLYVDERERTIYHKQESIDGAIFWSYYSLP